MVEKFTVVAFRYDDKRSILYRDTEYPSTAAKYVEDALTELKADVISIRRVMEKRPE